MTESDAGQEKYSDAVVQSIQLVYGRGFLSAGGATQVAEIVSGLPVEGCVAMELGCGLGGCSVALAGELGAGSVIAVDIEAGMVARTEAAAAAAGLSERITARLVEPGPLPFPDATFDLVFSKDVIAHVPDKEALYADLFRALRPGGHLAVSDWHKASDDTSSEAFDAWAGQLRDSGLWFEFAPAERHVRAMTAAGFEAAEARDRSAWAEQLAHEGVDRILGPAAQDLRRALGDEGYDGILMRTRARAEALAAGDLQYCHLRARKPA
jgi:phosphoethanolamine N-methyltransferase